MGTKRKTQKRKSSLAGSFSSSAFAKKACISEVKTNKAVNKIRSGTTFRRPINSNSSTTVVQQFGVTHYNTNTNESNNKNRQQKLLSPSTNKTNHKKRILSRTDPLYQKFYIDPVPGSKNNSSRGGICEGSLRGGDKRSTKTLLLEQKQFNMEQESLFEREMANDQRRQKAYKWTRGGGLDGGELGEDGDNNDDSLERLGGGSQNNRNGGNNRVIELKEPSFAITKSTMQLLEETVEGLNDCNVSSNNSSSRRTHSSISNNSIGSASRVRTKSLDEAMMLDELNDESESSSNNNKTNPMLVGSGIVKTPRGTRGGRRRLSGSLVGGASSSQFQRQRLYVLQQQGGTGLSTDYDSTPANDNGGNDDNNNTPSTNNPFGPLSDHDSEDNTSGSTSRSESITSRRSISSKQILLFQPATFDVPGPQSPATKPTNERSVSSMMLPSNDLDDALYDEYDNHNTYDVRRLSSTSTGGGLSAQNNDGFPDFADTILEEEENEENDEKSDDDIF